MHAVKPPSLLVNQGALHIGAATGLGDARSWIQATQRETAPPEAEAAAEAACEGNSAPRRSVQGNCTLSADPETKSAGLTPSREYPYTVEASGTLSSTRTTWQRLHKLHSLISMLGYTSYGIPSPRLSQRHHPRLRLLPIKHLPYARRSWLSVAAGPRRRLNPDSCAECCAEGLIIGRLCRVPEVARRARWRRKGERLQHLGEARH